jgi:hypothetical protein
LVEQFADTGSDHRGRAGPDDDRANAEGLRPTAASIVALPVMTAPENCRSPGLNAIQLAPKQQNIATAITYCRMRSQRGASAGKSPVAPDAPNDWITNTAPARK